ncbi:MAG TPA: hypothetical protein VEZ42_01720 [Pseudonocardia sp.]|nr:hypothetical protein [Pseudonocardia sp.]
MRGAALPPFDPNGYRKRVLATVEKRGGPDASDPFELYDLPVGDDLPDAAVAARIDEVWAFWQRQRDHPKYRVLVALLVAGHAERSAELRDPRRRSMAVLRVRQQREQRDTARFALLDAAISRLVSRHGGVPRDKVEGLYEVGALAGLERAEIEVRLRRHRLLDPVGKPAAPSGSAVGADRRRQIRALLDELGRLTDAPAPPTLLAMLGVGPDAGAAEVRTLAAAWRARARELPPARLRAVVDELMVHVAELIEPGDAAVAGYLDAVREDVAEHLRPRVRAAVLVEDRLVAEDHAHLLDEAVGLGLDRARATAVLAALAAELGAPIGDDPAAALPRAAGPTAAPTTDPTTDPTTARTAAGPVARPRPRRAPWEERLKAARAALRAGRAAQAQRLVREAARLAGADGGPPIRAVTDEVDAVLADAEVRWRAATGATGARRFAEAVEHLEHLARVAADVRDPSELLARARAEVERADGAVAEALAGPEADRAAGLLAVLERCPGHPGATAALDDLPVAPPAWVSAARDGRGDVLVLWGASPTSEVVYKVSRLRPDGSWHVVGRVGGTSLDDGGAPAGVEAPVYAVVAVQAGRASPPTRSDGPVLAASPPPVAATVPQAGQQPVGQSGGPAGGRAGDEPGGPPEPADPGPVVGPDDPPRPTGVRAARLTGGSVRVSWSPPAGIAPGAAQYRVRARTGPDGWRVVGRTTATDIEDGGAPVGAVPVYAVSAAVGGVRSAEARSDDS